MIPAIGYMVGAFIFTRMAVLLDQEDTVHVRFLALLTAGITLVCVGLIVYQDVQAGQAAAEMQRDASPWLDVPG